MNIESVVLDFDGTICLLFKNYDLSSTVHLLHTKMMEYNIEFPIESDAFDVFNIILSQTQNGSLRINALNKANEILTNAEIKAIDSCELVPGLVEVICDLNKSGIALGIASNNSSACIKKFTQQLFPEMPIAITGRAGTDPCLMKPNAWSLTETIKKLGCYDENTIFIGDTQSDYVCSKGTKCKFLGMAPTEKKRKRLLQFLSEDKIVNNYFELQDYLNKMYR